jgi:DNA-binding IscR family transcriptional regulator
VRGGYRLARPPGAITVGEVYRILEGEVAPVECTAEDYLPGSCGRETLCLSRSIWERVQAAILQVLDTTTLDDLVVSEALQHAAAAHFIPVESLQHSGKPSSSSKGEFAHA